MPSVILWGWDGTTYQKALIDAAGHLQVDVVTAGPTTGHCYGWDGATWQTLLVESAANFNLRVRQYDGANPIDSDLFDGATVPVTARGLDVIAAVYGWDGVISRPLLVDALGHPQVDVLTSALPTGAATAANQVTTHGYIDGLEGLLGAGLPATLDAGHLRVREQNWPVTYPLSAAQIALLQAVTVGNFPADYPLPAAQVASLQQVTEQGTPSVHLYGYNGAAWQTLLVESDVLKNLRVKLYDGANGIDSQLVTTEYYTSTGLRGLLTSSLMHVWASATVNSAIHCGFTIGDNDTLYYSMSVGLMGFDGFLWDRLRTWGVGVLKVGRAEINSTTVRLTGTGQVVAGAHNLYWLACNPSAGNSLWELTDAIAAAGAVVYDHFDSTRDSHHLDFDPPLKFATGIYLETFTNMTSVLFCYV